MEMMYPTSNESSAKKPTMNHAPVRGERVCECWGCLCAVRALVRVTSQSFATTTTADGDALGLDPNR